MYRTSILPQTIYDYSSRRIGPAGTVIADPYPNNRIPLSKINPTSLAIETPTRAIISASRASA